MWRPTRSPLPTERRILRPTADLHPASTAHHCRGDYTMDKATIRAAIYARVSSDQQVQEHTIGSQVEALEGRVREDGLDVEDSLRFIDEGQSGAVLVRPALERLRDQAAAGLIDRLYVHSPDRLARKYAYQILLVEEFQRCGIEVVFLNHEIGDQPEEQLLLQMQGMIAEYERAKILERSRRGKMHAARNGSVSVFSKAPYGYRYISKREGHGVARFEVIASEAQTLMTIFEWYGKEDYSLIQICERLNREGVLRRSGKPGWDPTSVWDMLKDTAYKGEALYGKSHVGEYRPHLRPAHGQPEYPRQARSITATPAATQIPVAVPAIVPADLFEVVQEKLAENKARRRRSEPGVRFLLQGLTVCSKCGYAYIGKIQNNRKGEGERRSYGYYFCTGTDRFRWGGVRICANTPVRMERLDAAVWEDVSALLGDPDRIRREFDRQKSQVPAPEPRRLEAIAKEVQRVKRGISRMLDLYQEGDLEKGEFEPRYARARQRLSELDSEASAISERVTREEGLGTILENFEQYARRVRNGLESAAWATRREIIRTLVKRIEIDEGDIHIVYRIGDPPFASVPERSVLQDSLPRRRSGRKLSERRRR
jgi:site-specific DNA recombinase